MNALRLVDDCFPPGAPPGPEDRARIPGVRPPRSEPRILGKLLAWNEEMVAQLQAERGDDTGAGFLTSMIAQHEKTIALLRAELDCRGAGIPTRR